MTDPNGWVQNPPTTFLKIVGTSRETLNGRYGVCVQYLQDKQRYNIVVVPTADEANGQQQVVALKADNLVACSFVEKMQAQYSMLRYNPDIQRQILEYYNRIQAMLPGNVKPEYAAIGVLVLLLIAIFVIGFSKVLLFASLLLLLFTVVAPDIQAGKAPRDIIKNLPFRWKNLLREQIPGGYGSKIVDNQYALAAVTVVVLYLFIKPLVTFTSSSTKSVPAAPPSPPGFVDTGIIPSSSVFTRDHFETIYKLGFDDATNDNKFGFSLPESVEEVNKLLGIEIPSVVRPKVVGVDPDNSGSSDEFEINYPVPNIPTVTKKRNNPFNIQTGLALFTLYRMIAPISINGEGKFDIELLKANLSTLDVWKLGIIGFSVYRLVAQFL